MAAFEFRVLGPLEVRRGGEPVAIAAPKQRALLGLLLLHRNKPVHQEELIELLWGESAPPTARASLQNLVHALRRKLGAERLERRADGYVLRVERGELDLDRFERLAVGARSAEPREKAAKLRSALDLWRGPPLVELPAEPFMQHEVARLEEERLIVLEDRIDVELELGKHAELAPELESLVERYPHRERIWAQLMVALYRCGRQAEALGAYRRAHVRFVEELGVDPGVELRDLQRAILVQDAALDEPDRRPGWTLERAAAILPSPASERAESLFDYGIAFMRTGELRRAVSTLDAAMRLAADIGDRSIEDRARLYLSYLAIWIDGKSAVEHLDEARYAAELFEARGDQAGLLVALRHQWMLLGPALGRADEAAKLSLEAAGVAAELGDAREEGACLGNWALHLALGSTPVAEALRGCERLLARKEWTSTWSAPSLPLGLWEALALLYAQLGRADEARAIADRAITQARRAGLLWLLLGCLVVRGEVELVAGDVESAAEWTRSAYAVVEAEDDHAMKPEWGATLAHLLARHGDVSTARELAFEARSLASPDDLVTHVGWRRALAVIAAADGRFDEAIRFAGEARVRANASDWLTFRAETLEDAAVVHALAGDGSGETQMLREALAVYERKGNVVGAARVRETIQGQTRRD